MARLILIGWEGHSIEKMVPHVLSTVSIYSLPEPLSSRTIDFSFNISFEGLPTNLGTWSLWSSKSGLNIPSEPQRRLALFCGLGGWAFIFWSNLINFGSSGSKVVWLIAKYDSNYRGSQEISNLAEISSVCTSQSWGSWSWGEGTQCALIFIQMYMCVGADEMYMYVSGGNVVLPLSSITGRGRLSCQLSVFRGLCILEKLSENTFSRKGLFGRQRWWWLEKEASSFRRLSPEGGRGVNLVFDRAPAHDY